MADEIQMPTTEKLAQALLDANLTEMAGRAREGYYHDFLSPLSNPAMTLAEDLQAAGTAAALALRALHLAGVFDASAGEADAWRASDEGQEEFEQLLLDGELAEDPEEEE